MSFDPSNFFRLLDTLGRGDDAAIRIGWASHEADFQSKLVVRDVIPSFIDGLLTQRVNIYFEINPSTHEGKGRTAANEVTQLVALWADIDFKGNGMRSEENAHALIQELNTVLGGVPAAIVYSGGGCQPYWLLDEVTAEQHGVDTIAALSKRWGNLVKRLALDLGGAADGVFDLARVFRVPGTVNVKYEGEPRPVTVEFDEEPQSWTLNEITDILDDWGVPEPDTGLSQDVLSPEADWKWAEEDCHFVAVARQEISTSEPVARHPWMLKWSALLYGMIRNECIREDSFYELRDLLMARFTWICQNAGSPRTPGLRELNDAFTYGLRRAQMWDQNKLNDELRHHVHRDFDEQFAWITQSEPAPTVSPAYNVLEVAAAAGAVGPTYEPPALPNTGVQLPYAEPPAPAPAQQSASEVSTLVIPQLKPRGVDRMKVAPRTDTGNAERLARKFAGEFIYVPDMGWMRFDGARYVRDTGAHHVERAKDVFMALYTTGTEADQKWALKSLGAGALTAALRLAQSTPEMLRDAMQLNTQAYDLCTPGGIVDLRTGQLRPADPTTDLNTQVTGVTPDWSMQPRRFLELLEWMQPDLEVRDYLQRLAGIALIGNVEHHVFPVFTGGGGNGKSVLMELESRAMGDYAAYMPRRFLVEKSNQDHPTEIAQLLGKRLAINNEVPPSARFDEDFVKSLVGDVTLRARFMRADFADFPNTALQVMLANHLPSVPAGGYSFWRRVRKVDFRAKVAAGKENPRLAAEIFAAEGSAILAWMIDGAREVIEHGEQVPQQVLIATDEYKFEEDAIARFISQRMMPMPGMAATRDAVYAIYRTWMLQQSLQPLQQQKFEREVLMQIPDARSTDPTRDHLFEGWSVAGQVYEMPTVEL